MDLFRFTKLMYEHRPSYSDTIDLTPSMCPGHLARGQTHKVIESTREEPHLQMHFPSNLS